MNKWEASHFRTGERVHREVIALLAHLQLTLKDLPKNPGESIHDLRTSMKKAKATLLIFARPSLMPILEAAQHRTRRLKDFYASDRDEAVLQVTFSEIIGAPAGATNKKSRTTLSVPDELWHCASELAEYFAALPIREFSREDILRGIRTTWKDGRSLGLKCRKNPEAHRLHEWRKKVKALGYQLLVGAKTRQLQRAVNQASRLGTLLGEDHDLHLLEQKLQNEPHWCAPHEAAVILKKIGRIRTKRQKKAFALAAKLYDWTE